MKIIRKNSFYFIVLLLLGMSLAVTGTATIVQEEESRKKYIKFSHQYHIEEVEADCISCHVDIESSTAAADNNLSNKEACAECHDVDDTDACDVCHYDIDEAVALPNPVREVMFSHQAHMERIGDERCEACHRDLEKTDYAMAAHRPTMDDCTVCHNNTSAPQFCESCHTQLPTLRPHSHMANWMQRHDEAVRGTNEDCSTCHSFDYCQECHDGAVLVSADAGTPAQYSSNAPLSWGAQNMVLKKNHDINYRFTHPVEAKSKLENCSLCHDNQTFCNDCHEASLINGKPSWHGGPNWGAQALMVGSGGGKHAEMAKRDISTCASCHDPYGSDPACLQCHTDRLPGKGNDPRTHSKMSYNYRGPWHDDNEHTCFTCHINREKSIPGSFCGYCHSTR